MLRILVGVVVAALVGIGMSAEQAIPAAAGSITYDDFMRLDVNQRQQRFDRLPAETKAAFVRNHAEQWLSKNSADLDGSQVAVLREAIAFVTPALYEKPLDPDLMKREQDVKASFTCRVKPDVVAAAFDLLGRSALPPGTARWSYLSRAKCWIGWFAESVIGSAIDYIPTLPKSGR